MKFPCCALQSEVVSVYLKDQVRLSVENRNSSQEMLCCIVEQALCTQVSRFRSLQLAGSHVGHQRENSAMKSCQSV